MGHKIKPLNRSVNTRTHGVHHGTGRAARYERYTKAQWGSEVQRGSMHSGQQHGLDYTPLFRFLLSRVGEDWDEIHSSAVPRLDREGPIFGWWRWPKRIVR